MEALLVLDAEVHRTGLARMHALVTVGAVLADHHRAIRVASVERIEPRSELVQRAFAGLVE